MSDETPARSRSQSIAIAFAAGAVAAALALPLIPAETHTVGPATINARVELGPGRTVLVFPPLGTVQAATHAVPLALRVSLAELDVPALAGELGSAETRSALNDELEADLRGLAQRVAIRLVLGALLIGALVAGLLPGRHWRSALAGAAGGALVAGVAVIAIGASFDVDAFEEPRFTGALTRAPVVIEALRRHEITIPEVRSRYDTAAERLSDLLALVARPDRDPRANETAILHVSDIHSNPLGVELVDNLARRFEVDAVIDTGDLTNFGLAVEGNIGKLIRRIPVPYLFVPGNHDSAANEQRLDAIPNVTVLHDAVVQVGDIEIMGWSDPTYTNWNRLSSDEVEDILTEEAELVADVVRLRSPDVLAVHNPLLAEGSFGETPLVLAGHEHERILEEEDDTLLLAVGSTGATGFKFFVESARDYEAEIVYFRDGLPTTVDYVQFSGLGSDFEIERTTLPPAESDGARLPIRK